MRRHVLATGPTAPPRISSLRSYAIGRSSRLLGWDSRFAVRTPLRASCRGPIADRSFADCPAPMFISWVHHAGSAGLFRSHAISRMLRTFFPAFKSTFVPSAHRSETAPGDGVGLIEPCNPSDGPPLMSDIR
jgi:hypothetical protein